MNTGGPSPQCSGCGATVHGQPGAMKCPYCGMRVDIPMDPTARPAAILPDETEEERQRARRHNMYEDAEDAKPVESASGNSGAIIGAVVGVAVVGIIIALAVSSSHKKSKTASSGLERKAQNTSTTTPTKPSRPTTYESIMVSSCRCAFGDGQSTPLITLTPLAAPTQDPSRSLSMRIESQMGYVSSTSSPTLALPLGTALTPLDGGDLPRHMGVACDTGFYVLVVDHVATGWSSVNARWKWNATLPAALADGADAGAPSPLKGTDFGGFCTPLTVQNGAVSIGMTNGKRASLSIKDGKIH